MSHTHKHASEDKVTVVTGRIAAICLIAAFISALYYAFQVSVSDGIFHEPIYLWNFSCVALIVGCAFGMYAYWRKCN